MAGTVTRVRPALRRLAWWTLPVMLLIAAWQIWDGIEARRVERALRVVNAGGPDVAQVFQPPTTDDAARYYAAAAIAAVSHGGTVLIQSSPGGARQDVLDVMRDAMSRGTDAPATVIEAASKQIQSDEVVLELLGRGSELPFGGFAPGTEFNYRFSGLFEVNRSASLRTLAQIRNGNEDAAARLMTDRARLLRAFDRSQGLIASASKASLVQTLATDVGILVSSSPSDRQLEDLKRALQSLYTDDEFERSIRAEIVRRYDTIRVMLSTRGPMAAVPLRPLIRHQFVAQLQVATELIEKARLPWPERIREVSQLPDRHSTVFGSLRFIGFWNAPVLAAREAEAIAAWRCARLVVEVEQFRRARGRLPETLEELDGPGGQEDLSDPFTGRSLRYIPADGEYVIYSVGRNVQDENGTFTPSVPSGRLPNMAPRPDVGVRVPARKSRVYAPEPDQSIRSAR